MTANTKKQMTLFASLMTTLALMIGVIVFCAAVWVFVPLLWEGLCISAVAIWSVFMYWSNKTHYIGIVTCFMTIWFGATIFPLKATDKYLKHRRCVIVATVITSVINALFFGAYIATSPGILQEDPGIFDMIYAIASLGGPIAAISIGKEFWKEQYYGH